MKRGDHVTRDGSDVQEVVEIDPDGFCGTFRCIVPPLSGWCAVGDEEYNLCRRYSVIPIDTTWERVS